MDMWRGYIMASDPNQIGVNTPSTNENVSNPSKNEKHAIALAPLRRLMKGEGATIVSTDAIIFLRDQLELKASQLVKKATMIVNAEKRKRIQASDIQDVTKIV